MTHIKQIIRPILHHSTSTEAPASPSASLATPSALTGIDPQRYWREQFVHCMRQSSPRFVVDDRNRALVKSLYGWVWGTDWCPLDPRKGLLLWGPIGVGKSTLLKGIRAYELQINRMHFAYANRNLGFGLRSASEIALDYAQRGIDAIERYARITNLAIDEMGREPAAAKHYGTHLNPVQLLLQLRYENRHYGLTHITTNLNPNTEFDPYGGYITDRVKEMCNVIEIGGHSRR